MTAFAAGESTSRDCMSAVCEVLTRGVAARSLRSVVLPVAPPVPRP